MITKDKTDLIIITVREGFQISVEDIIIEVDQIILAIHQIINKISQ
jgi:hypothetical protein